MSETYHTADRILSMADDSHVHSLVAELIRWRDLGPLVRSLNADVVCGAGSEKDKAIAALRRIGLWSDG